MKNCIGIIGIGMVGGAVLESVSHHFPALAYDPKGGLVQHGMGPAFHVEAADPFTYMAAECDLIFVCVPTPMRLTGSQDLSILEEVAERLDAGVRLWRGHPDYANRSPLVVIKSTVQPGTTDRLQWLYKGTLRFAFNPEFLREATAKADFKEQDRIILGTRRAADSAALDALYETTHPNAARYFTDPVMAEMVKYAGNCFLAVKVSFANEFAQICEAAGVHYEELRRLLVTDKRIGDSHLTVPGPDGKKGFGLTCFPKDLNAMIRFAVEHGVDPTVMRAAWHKNLEVRPERDWETMLGRAVSVEDRPAAPQCSPVVPECPAEH